MPALLNILVSQCLLFQKEFTKTRQENSHSATLAKGFSFLLLAEMLSRRMLIKLLSFMSEFEK
jgi:hypothetical protein